jgi:hypothetical protein
MGTKNFNPTMHKHAQQELNNLNTIFLWSLQIKEVNEQSKSTTPWSFLVV